MFRFTIRDVLWLTVVVALAAGWWRDHRALQSLNYQFEMVRWRARAEALKRHIERNGETVSWNRSQLGDAEEISVGSNNSFQVYSPSLVGDDRAPVSSRPWEAADRK